jgi:uncharacterized membrane protein YgdD (TMEM256/DUF423 family)
MTVSIVLIALSGLMGAAGVALMAAAAHSAPGTGLDSAGSLLLVHAAAVLTMTALFERGLLWRPLAIAVAAGFVIGAALFASDVSLRAFAGHRLFPMAAPTGGMTLILSWLALTICAITTAMRG